MATPAPPPVEHVGQTSKDDNDGTNSIFSRALLFTTHVIFGILALGGCLLVQCLLVVWFALLTAQAHSLSLQARMLEYVYGVTIEKAQSERKKRKKKNVIRIEISPPQGDNAQKPEIIRQDFSFDENISLNIRTSVPEISPPVKDPSPPKVEVPPPKPSEPLSVSSPRPREQKPIDPKPQAAETTSSGVIWPVPKVNLPISNPYWQTKSVRERKAGGGRYAVKQVDVFTPGNDEQQEPFTAPTPKHDGFFEPETSNAEEVERTSRFGERGLDTFAANAPPQHDSFEGSFLESASERDGLLGFLVPAASSSTTRQRFGSFLGHTSATTVATAPFQAPTYGRHESYFEPEIKNIKDAERVAEVERQERLHGPRTYAAVANAPFRPELSSEWVIPSSAPAFPTDQKTTLMPRPLGKLPGMSPSSGNQLNVPKRELDLESSALGHEQHPANSAPKKIRRSMIKLVKPETPLQLLPKPQPSSDQNLAKIEVAEPPKLAAPVETSNINSTEAFQPTVTATPVETSNSNSTELSQPVVTATQTSQGTRRPSSAGTVPNFLADVGPVDTEVEVDEPLDLRRLYDTAMARARLTISQDVKPVKTDRLRHKVALPLYPNSPKPQPTASDYAQAAEVAKPKLSQDTTNRSSPGAGTSISATVEPVQIDQLRHRFLDTSVLKVTPAEKPQLKLMPAIQPISPEEVAREALVNAFHERESTRVELSRNYSPACVERFLERAQEYKARRKSLASLMPSGNLSFEDEASFPYLSTKDTNEPMVPSPTVSDSQRPYPLPSPPTSGEEDDEQHILREDPTPLLAKASRAYQVLLKAAENMEEECLDCNSKFCLNAYSPAGRRKIKSAKELYQKSRSRLRDAYESGHLPNSLADQYPEVGGC